MMALRRAFVGLGSNLGDRAANLERACEGLRRTGGIEGLRLSGLIETEPVGSDEHPATGGPYLNAAVEIQVHLTPLEILARCLEIETSMGRVRTVPNAEREIDLDLLLYEDRILSGERIGPVGPVLELPHPRLHERTFVLEPLLELDPSLRHPVTGRPLREYLEELRSREPSRGGGLR